MTAMTRLAVLLVNVVVGFLILSVWATSRGLTENRIVAALGEVVLYLESAELTLYGDIRFHFLDFITSIMTCKRYRANVKKTPIVWGETFVSCLILQFGGTSTVAIFLGMPPWWALRYSSSLAFIISWWLVFCSPYDAVWKLFAKFPDAEIPLDLLGSISSGHAITSWGMDRVIFNNMNYFDPALLTRSIGFAIVSGTVASSGGGLWGSLLNLMGKQTYHMKNGLFTLFKEGEDGDKVRDKIARNVALSVCYFCILNPAGIFPAPVSLFNRNFGKQVVCVLSLIRFVLEVIWPDFQPAGMSFAFLLRVLQIPKAFYIEKDGGGNMARRSKIKSA